MVKQALELASRISACLITKDAFYPREVLNHVAAFGFGEVLVLTKCDSPHRKQELFEKAKYDLVYYQDDDCIAPIEQLLIHACDEGTYGKIVCAMKPAHIQAYAHSRIALIGWGSIFPKLLIHQLHRYRSHFGEDFLYKRETERIMTWLNYPQVRLDLPITDLPSAYAADRLSMQPGHYDYIPQVEARCAELIRLETRCPVGEPGPPGVTGPQCAGIYQ